MKHAHLTSTNEKNYITVKGLEKLREEFRKLKYDERPQIVETVSWAAANGDRSENGDYIYGKKRLREIDKRLEFLSKRIDIAEVIDPTQMSRDFVAIGATVTTEDDEGNTKIFKIVGADETDPDNNKISWKSPIAKALLKSKEGDYITYNTPSGEHGLEVIKIEYIEIA